MCVVRLETPPPHHNEVGEGVEHVLATLAHGRVGRRATGGRSLGVWGEDRSPGADQGTDSTDLGQGVLSVPLLPGAALSSPARSFPSTEMWPAMLMESRGERAQPIPAGPCTDAGMQEPFGTTPVALSVLGWGSVQPVRSRRGRVPACVPAIRG